jgi:5-methylcytosine-specific restriction endonuclease McrA
MPTKTGYRKWYDKRAWRRRSAHQLRTHPLCAYCLARDPPAVTPAQIADHVMPHKGSINVFWQSKLQSLCWSCHSSIKQQQEFKGFANAIGPDGYPLDQGHPIYKNNP